MILRDIELDSPSFLQNGTISEEVLEVLRKQKLVFRLQTRCMTSMVTRLLPKIHISNFQKIRIICNNMLSSPTATIDSPVCSVNVLFDFNRFATCSDLEKKIMVINTVENAVSIIEQELNITLDGIADAIQSVRMLNYENTWIWKDKKSKSKYVGVEVQHLVDKVVITLFCKFNGEIIAQKSIEDIPTEWSYSRVLGKLAVDNSNAILFNKMDNEVLHISW